MPAVVNGAGLAEAVPSIEESNGGVMDGDSGAYKFADAGEKKPKLTRNQMKRMKKKEKKAEGRESRESSVSTPLASEAKGVCLDFLL
jgi:hypothetical protein